MTSFDRPAEQPQTDVGHNDGVVLQVANCHKQSAYMELSHGGPQQLRVLGWDVGGRWTAEAQRFWRDMLRVRSHRAPPVLHVAARAGGSRC